MFETSATEKAKKAVSVMGCLCGPNCLNLSLMPRLLLGSLVIDRMSDWSVHFCGDTVTINYP